LSLHVVAPASSRFIRPATNQRTHAGMRPNQDSAAMRTTPSMLARRAIVARLAPSP